MKEEKRRRQEETRTDLDYSLKLKMKRKVHLQHCATYTTCTYTTREELALTSLLLLKEHSNRLRLNSDTVLIG